MKLLVPPSGGVSYLDRFIEVRDSKHLPIRSQLRAIHSAVAAQFSFLESATAARTLHLATPCPTCKLAEDSLRSCYKSPTAALRKLKGDIKAAQPPRTLQRCPMCGITLPATFDHYLPSSVFPEFSVHAMNLVPCCSTCNSTKDDDWLSAHSERQYLHFYSDPLPSDAFLSVTLIESADGTAAGAHYSLVRPAGVSNIAWRIITSHCERLHLLDRYAEISGDEIAELLSLCRSSADAGAASAHVFLESYAANLEAVFGKSHWRAVLARAFAGHPNLQALVASSGPLVP